MELSVDLILKSEISINNVFYGFSLREIVVETGEKFSRWSWKWNMVEEVYLLWLCSAINWSYWFVLLIYLKLCNSDDTLFVQTNPITSGFFKPITLYLVNQIIPAVLTYFSYNFCFFLVFWRKKSQQYRQQ